MTCVGEEENLVSITTGYRELTICQRSRREGAPDLDPVVSGPQPQPGIVPQAKAPRPTIITGAIRDPLRMLGERMQLLVKVLEDSVAATGSE